MGLLAQYNYDDLGRRTALVRGNGLVTGYGYDAASRLGAMSEAGPVANYAGFAYNPAGQITQRTGNNPAYDWDAHYNVDRGYGVNGLNQLTISGYTPLSYDPLGRLTQLQAEAQTLLYDGADLVAEYGWDGSLHRRYVPDGGADEPIAWYEGTGTGDRRFFHADERGSIVALTNSGGAKVAINTYDEYGIPGTTNVGRLQYTGQKWIPSLGMYDYKARTYSPTLGRFLQTDPIGYADGMNLYNYVGGDPVNNIDPSGLGGCDTTSVPPGGILICGNKGHPNGTDADDAVIVCPDLNRETVGPDRPRMVPSPALGSCQISAMRATASLSTRDEFAV